MTIPETPNHARGCVKTLGAKFGNAQIFDMGSYDEMSRRIRWLKNEFSHSLALQPTPVGVVSSAAADHVVVPAWLSFGR